MKHNRTVRILLFAIATPVVFLVVAFFFLGGPGSREGNPLPVNPAGSTLNFAHRGITVRYPENSQESLGEAKRLGFRAVEFDLRKSADGEFILFHDSDCRRMLGLNEPIKKIPVTGLKYYPLLMNGKKTSCFVPTLTDVFDRYSHDFIFYLDMKLSGFRDADQIVEIIHRYGIESTCVVASADLLFVFYIKYRHPGILTALEGYNAGKEWTYNLIPEDLKPDFLSGFLSRVDENHIRWLKRKELLSNRIVYGVDSSNYLSAREMGLQNLILDYDTVSQVFGKSKRINH